MKPINSIESLAKELDNASKTDRPKIIKNLQLDAEEIKQYATWCGEGYTRNCLLRTDDYELLLLCWDKKSETPIHDHSGQDCWVYQIAGDIEELRYKENNEGEIKKTNELTLHEGGISYMHDRMGYHKIKNPNDTRAMTLHIYAEPIDSCNVFDPKKETFELAEMEYDTVVEEMIS